MLLEMGWSCVVPWLAGMYWNINSTYCLWFGIELSAWIFSKKLEGGEPYYTDGLCFAVSTSCVMSLLALHQSGYTAFLAAALLTLVGAINKNFWPFMSFEQIPKKADAERALIAWRAHFILLMLAVFAISTHEQPRSSSYHPQLYHRRLDDYHHNTEADMLTEIAQIKRGIRGIMEELHDTPERSHRKPSEYDDLTSSVWELKRKLDSTTQRLDELARYKRDE
jgi:hypothetical protein